jgi:hypothetical protein
MRFWQIFDEWLFSPPCRYASVLRMTDVLLRAAEPEYAAQRQTPESPSTSPPAPEGQPPSSEVHSQE